MRFSERSLQVVHKDAISKLGQPVFDFQTGTPVYAVNGQRADNSIRPMDKGFAMGCDEMADQLSCAVSRDQNGNGYDFSGGAGTDAVTESESVYVEFTEIVCIGPLGPWSLLYPSEMSMSSDFSKFCPMIPFVNNFQLNMQFDQTQLAGNLFALVRNGHNKTGNMTATIAEASLLCKFVLPPPSYPLKSFDSFSVQSFEVVKYAQEIDAMGDRRSANRRAKPKVSYYTLNESPNFFFFSARPRAEMWPKQLLKGDDYAKIAGGAGGLTAYDAGVQE